MSETEEGQTSTESTVTTESPVTEAVSENSGGERTESTVASDKPAGYAPVDPVTASPEQVKERLDYLYGQVKHSDREKREMRNILSEQSRIINELSAGQQAVVGHLTQKSFTEGKQQLQTAMQDAWQKQDNRAYIEAQNKLMDLQVEERLAAKQQPVQQQQPQQRLPQSAAEIANGAVQRGEINQDEYRATETWQNERDGNGNLIRPWAFGSDPTHLSALYEARSVLANPRLAGLSYEQKLQEIDRRMGVQKKTSSQSVIGGSLTKPGKSGKLQLTEQQRTIALKTNYAGKGKSEADHLEKYRQQVEKYSQRRAK